VTNPARERARIREGIRQRAKRVSLCSIHGAADERREAQIVICVSLRSSAALTILTPVGDDSTQPHGGKGPVERQAFLPSCLSNVPDFKDDVYWAAKVVEGQVQFEPLEASALKEGVIKVLFRSVKGTTQRWESARPVTTQAPYDDQRILADLVNREQNRKTWYTKGGCALKIVV
jgi:hypothetical protein